MKEIDKFIIEQLKKCSIVSSYMTDREMIEYYKKEYKEDYESLKKLYS